MVNACVLIVGEKQPVPLHLCLSAPRQGRGEINARVNPVHHAGPEYSRLQGVTKDQILVVSDNLIGPALTFFQLTRDLLQYYMCRIPQTPIDSHACSSKVMNASFEND